MSKDADKVGRLFNAKIVELALANFPGWTGRSGVVPSGPFIEYWPALVDANLLGNKFILGETKEAVPQLDYEEILYQKEPYSNPEVDKTILEEVPLAIFTEHVQATRVDVRMLEFGQKIKTVMLSCMTFNYRQI